MALIGTTISEAINQLRNNALVAIPTETVYGLAANALKEEAVLKIFEAKQRPFFDPLIIHLPSITSISLYADLNNKKLQQLAQTFWPGPLTLLLPKKNNVPSIVTSGLATIAVRIPNHSVTLSLLNQLDFPLAAPSANPFGYISPTTALHVQKQLGHKINYILDGGSCNVGLESTIVGVEDDIVCIYRLGGLSISDIESVIGKVELKINHSSNPKAPGQLKSHYAPKKPLFIGDLEELVNQYKNKKLAVICFGDEPKIKSGDVVFNLSRSKNLKEAALNLFNYLRIADECDSEIVIASFVEQTGLGLAVNDRLQRASVSTN